MRPLQKAAYRATPLRETDFLRHRALPLLAYD